MELASDDQVEKVYGLLLERLDTDEKAEVLEIVAVSEQALRNTCTEYEQLQQDDERVSTVTFQG
jgi:hypothetical protein